jgi:RNA polymerase-binding transcription factor DksA
MSSTVMSQHQSLTKSQVQQIKAELARQSRRFAPDDPHAHAYAVALDRIERGTYGYCAACGDRIPHERLSVMPETLYCVGCRRDHS